MSIRILVVDDHMVVRAGLSQVLSAVDDLTVVGEAENGEEALYLCQKTRPDVVVMDVRMQGMGGAGATEALCRYHPEVRVIGLSTFADDQTVSQMLDAGARGFLPKSVSTAELVNVVRRVHAGEIVVNADQSPVSAPSVATSPASPTDLELRGQQRRVLALLTRGFTNAEIGSYLDISLPTARYHVSAILLKLGVSNRAEAAALAVRNGLVADTDF